MPMITALEGLEKLREGNARFASDVRSLDSFVSHARRAELAGGQEPFAVILGCSDSRVPLETVFDQGLGTLFVIRVAGNIVAPSQVGSVEFAVERFGTRLVVVLGHTLCGAIRATVDELRRPAETRSPNLRSIVDRIRPSVQPLIEAHPGEPSEELMRRAMRANVSASVDHLCHGSEILESQVRNGGLLVVGADYDLETGVVDFFEGVPATVRN